MDRPGGVGVDTAPARSAGPIEEGSKGPAPGGRCSKDGPGRKGLQRPAQKVFTLGDIRLYECPVSYISRDTVELMRLVYLIDGSKGLLYSGGWGDQPAWLVEAVEAFRMETVGRTREGKEV
ncbi:hypothetical protein MNBD_DELTA02-725 [hydrothermal vent metagenome]|uniref:Uncharacterized protein n=1 Tax=hydrothermal vent metagenome TaxID=652676 RepID=A0A3B0VLU9_9ZZZZ